MLRHGLQLFWTLLMIIFFRMLVVRNCRSFWFSFQFITADCRAIEITTAYVWRRMIFDHDGEIDDGHSIWNIIFSNACSFPRQVEGKQSQELSTARKPLGYEFHYIHFCQPQSLLVAGIPFSCCNMPTMDFSLLRILLLSLFSYFERPMLHTHTRRLLIINISRTHGSSAMLELDLIMSIWSASHKME